MKRALQVVVLSIVSATVLMASPTAKPRTTAPITPVPEPASVVLLASGVAALIGFARRK